MKSSNVLNLSHLQHISKDEFENIGGNYGKPLKRKRNFLEGVENTVVTTRPHQYAA